MGNTKRSRKRKPAGHEPPDRSITFKALPTNPIPPGPKGPTYLQTQIHYIDTPEGEVPKDMCDREEYLACRTPQQIMRYFESNEKDLHQVLRMPDPLEKEFNKVHARHELVSGLKVRHIYYTIRSGTRVICAAREREKIWRMRATHQGSLIPEIPSDYTIIYGVVSPVYSLYREPMARSMERAKKQFAFLGTFFGPNARAVAKDNKEYLKKRKGQGKRQPPYFRLAIDVLIKNHDKLLFDHKSQIIEMNRSPAEVYAEIKARIEPLKDIIADAKRLAHYTITKVSDEDEQDAPQTTSKKKESIMLQSTSNLINKRKVQTDLYLQLSNPQASIPILDSDSSPETNPGPAVFSSLPERNIFKSLLPFELLPPDMPRLSSPPPIIIRDDDEILPPVDSRPENPENAVPLMLGRKRITNVPRNSSGAGPFLHSNSQSHLTPWPIMPRYPKKRLMSRSIDLATSANPSKKQLLISEARPNLSITRPSMSDVLPSPSMLRQSMSDVLPSPSMLRQSMSEALPSPSMLRQSMSEALLNSLEQDPSAPSTSMRQVPLQSSGVDFRSISTWISKPAEQDKASSFSSPPVRLNEADSSTASSCQSNIGSDPYGFTKARTMSPYAYLPISSRMSMPNSITAPISLPSEMPRTYAPQYSPMPSPSQCTPLSMLASAAALTNKMDSVDSQRSNMAGPPFATILTCPKCYHKMTLPSYKPVPGMLMSPEYATLYARTLYGMPNSLGL